MEINFVNVSGKVFMMRYRTDNSIKNQFYSTVRRCLRKINRLRGDKNSTINMKTVKPSVLSKIVENTELTNLIVRLGKGRT